MNDELEYVLLYLKPPYQAYHLPIFLGQNINILTIWIIKRDTDDRWRIDSRRLETERKKNLIQTLSTQKRD